MPENTPLGSPGKKVLPPNSTATQAEGDAQNKAIEAGNAVPSNLDADIAHNTQATNQFGGTHRTLQHVDGGFAGGSHEVFDYSVDKQSDPNYQANRDKINGLVDTIGARKNATMAGTSAAAGDLSQDTQTRARQNALLDSLSAQANGTGGPTAAQQLLKTGADRAQAAALARAAAGGTAGARRQASFEGAAATQDAAGAATALRAQEQQSAQALLGQTAAGVRQQDQGVAQLGQQNNQFNAGLTQDTNKTNLQSGVDQQGQRDAQILALTGAGLSLDEANKQYELQQSQFNAGLGVQQEASKLGVAQQGAGQNAAIIGAGIGAAGAGLAGGLSALAPKQTSDARAKKDIANADKDVESFLDHIGAKEFAFKEPAKDGAGRRAGVLAQDVEKSPVGAMVISVAPDGTKQIDNNKAISVSLASLANINKRLRSLGA